MNDFKVTQRKKFNLTGKKQDLILLAREIGTEKKLKQIKENYDEKSISRTTYFNWKKIISTNLNLIENQEFEALKNI